MFFKGTHWSIALSASVTTFSKSGISTIHSRSVRTWRPAERRFTFTLQLLSGEEFLKRIIGLVEPLGDVQYPNRGVSSVMRENRSSLIGFMCRADLTANVITVAGAVGSAWCSMP